MVWMILNVTGIIAAGDGGYNGDSCKVDIKSGSLVKR